MKYSDTPQTVEGTWRQIREMIEMPARMQVRSIVEHDAELLSDLFYREMLAHPDMGRLLDHETVNRRLHASMARWLRTLFDESTPVDELVAAQRRAGEVHARIGVSHTAVGNGARVLKRAIARQLIAAPGESATVAGAVKYVYELVDIAMEAMGESTSSNSARMARSDEAYRLLFMTQDLRAERERQKSQLLEWTHQLLVHHYWDAPAKGASSAPLSRTVSQFELWIDHKASTLFETAPELPLIRQRIADIEHLLIPRLKSAHDDHTSAKTIVTELHRQVEQIKDLLGMMFDQAEMLEDGRDDVTRLLNRRYFPSIAKREIGLAQAGGQPFALLLLCMDRFADIGHALGAEVSDLVLAQVADALSEAVRAGDFVFRVGDDQFLVLLVEAAPAAALTVAEGLRTSMMNLTLRIPLGLAPKLTISVGVAFFDGHPDYQLLLERAEAALREARVSGGNRVVEAEPLT
jgi:diguanylate cyclase